MRRFGLLPRVLLAIGLGLGCGFFFPDWLTRVFVTFNGLFGNFLNFVIPLIIVGLITPAIGELGRGAGKWLGLTAGLAYLSTIIAGLFSLLVSVSVYPGLLAGMASVDFTNPEDSLLSSYFTVEMTPVMGVMSALLVSFVLGIGLTITTGETLTRAFVEFREIVNAVIAKVIIPLLPIYIFGIILNLSATGEALRIIGTFFSVILVVFAMTVVLLLFQYTVAGVIARKNPLTMLRTMMPAYATALGTSSSAATIPVTLASARRMGVSKAVSAFTIPLLATVHLAGSTLKITSFAVAIMVLNQMPISMGVMIGFILMLGITMVAAPGVPGGAIMAAAGLLSSMLGFSDAQVGLMIATYIAIDSFGTATNVTGDGALSTIIDRVASGRLSAPDVTDTVQVVVVD